MTEGFRLPAGTRRAVRRALYRHGRPIRAVLVGAAVAATLGALAPAPQPSRSVVVATADLSAGTVLGPGDVAVARYPADRVPDGSYGRPDVVVGRALAGAVRRAEPLTDVRMLGSGALTGSTGLVEVAVRIADAGATRLVRPGDLVDVLAARPDPAASGYLDPSATSASAADAGGEMATVVAASARVLGVPAPADPGAGGSEGALVVLAVTPTTARVLAAAAAAARLSVLIRPAATDP